MSGLPSGAQYGAPDVCSLNEAKTSLNEASCSLKDAKCSLNEAKSSLKEAKCCPDLPSGSKRARCARQPMEEQDRPAGEL